MESELLGISYKPTNSHRYQTHDRKPTNRCMNRDTNRDINRDINRDTNRDINRDINRLNKYKLKAKLLEE